MFAFLAGLAAVCAVNVWVSRAMHEQNSQGLPTGPHGS